MSTETPPPALVLTQISKGFPGVQALQDVSFSVASGEVHALLGENGAGKSTLLKILSGIYRADAGSVLIDGRTADLRSPKSARRAGIALIHQELQQIPELDVAQNIFLGSALTTLGIFTNISAMRRRATELLAALDPSIDVRSRIGDLRVAQRQIVEIAKALLGEARVIAMDEPTSSLTPIEFERLVAVIHGLAAKGVAVIYVSHKLEEVFRVASRATVLRDGRKVGDVDLAGLSEDALVAMMVGRNLVIPEHKSSLRDEVVLSVRDLGRGSAVRGASFDLRRGEVLGIAGLVGSGRTELVKLIAGVDQPTSGTMALRGSPLTLRTPRDAIARGIGLLPEDRKKEGIIPLRSIASNVALPSLGRLVRAGILRGGEMRRQVDTLTHNVSLRPHAIDRPIRLFSGGNQQKAILSRWLMAGSDVLIFDEPTRGIDVGAKDEIYRLIEVLAQEGRSVIVVSSELPELLRLCDNVLVMRRGEMVGSLPRGLLGEAAIMNLAISGRTAA